MVSVLTAVVVVLASARLWRLAAVDSLTDSIREILPDKVTPFLACPFCSGFWIALGVAASAIAWADTWPWWLILGSLAVSYIGGHLNRVLDLEE